MEFERIHTSGDNEHYRAKIVTKRNYARLNNHQQLQLQGWRANCDIQVVVDHYACVEYLTKYAAKGEPRSPMLKQACTDYSLLDVYGNREEYESSQDLINMNFVQFATTYKIAREYYTTNISNIFS